MTLRYLSTLAFDEGWLAALRERVPGVDVVQVSAEKAGDVPDDLWLEVDALHTGTAVPDPATAPRLRWVQLDTSGVDHVLDTALWASSVPITTIGGVSPVPLAEYVMFAVLGFAHRLPVLLDVRATRAWPSPAQRWQTLMPRALPGTTMGIVGYGRIGREIGRLARAHGMTVVGMNRSGSRPAPDAADRQVVFAPDPADDEVTIVGPDRLPDLLAMSDWVVVVVPLTPQTRHLIDAEAFAAMRPGAVLVDVARGGVVDEAALRDALHSGLLGGAVLDVFTDEPLPPDSPWWGEPNVLVTPHVAGLAPRYAEQVLDLVSANLRRLLAGDALLNTVDRARRY